MDACRCRHSERTNPSSAILDPDGYESALADVRAQHLHLLAEGAYDCGWWDGHIAGLRVGMKVAVILLLAGVAAGALASYLLCQLGGRV